MKLFVFNPGEECNIAASVCSLHRGQTFVYLRAEPLYEMQVLNKDEL